MSKSVPGQRPDSLRTWSLEDDKPNGKAVTAAQHSYHPSHACLEQHSHILHWITPHLCVAMMDKTHHGESSPYQMEKLLFPSPTWNDSAQPSVSDSTEKMTAICLNIVFIM
ncbi:hypothetical protein DV515_00014472 [Chloebia gouldiae]|uniref:Uncharacterized protein n=1 Tax=Chloebia gouldiae TaxID=44316 RepID=A0A3L8RZL4_CHLGU|nr:hypothetical protein DV515_00014472 [Chloebia gouldiae]